MTIQKKSLINTLSTSKKAIIASSTKDKPSVNAPVSARVAPRVKAKIRARVNAHVVARVKAPVKA